MSPDRVELRILNRDLIAFVLDHVCREDAGPVRIGLTLFVRAIVVRLHVRRGGVGFHLYRLAFAIHHLLVDIRVTVDHPTASGVTLDDLDVAGAVENGPAPVVPLPMERHLPDVPDTHGPA